MPVAAIKITEENALVFIVADGLAGLFGALDVLESFVSIPC
jgi:hypothetical protein